MKVYRYVCILVVILVMTIFTISEDSRVIKIGYEITEMEKELKKLSEENKKLALKSDKLKTYDKISLKVKDMKLNLIISDGYKDITIVKTPQEQPNKNLHGKIET